MKAFLKILVWLGIGGTVGYFTGKAVTEHHDEKVKDDQCKDCAGNCDNCVYGKARNMLNAGQYSEAMDAIDDVLISLEDMFPADDPKPAVEEAEQAQQEYLGNDSDDPDMVTETPVIGDEESIDITPMYEIISEQEFYENSKGYTQEELIWYSLDEKLFNKETNKVESPEECIQMLGRGTLDMFRDPGTTALFVRNNLLTYAFRVDRYDAAYADERGDTYDDEEGTT